MEFILFLIIAIIIISFFNTWKSGAWNPSDEWYKSQYKWETVSTYFKKMIDEKLAPLNDAEKKFFYGNQVLKIQNFISLQKQSPTENNFQKWIIEEADEILSKIDESQIQGENAKKAYLYSAIMGQIVFASKNDHLLHTKQKIYHPTEKFFYYSYEETLKRLNLIPYNRINDMERIAKNYFK